MTVLSFNWSLNGLERFCTKEKCSVLSIDPTFNFGDFYVIVTTYQHLVLENSGGSHPVIMGPIFVHQQKKIETYYFFCILICWSEAFIVPVGCFWHRW